MNKFAVRLRKLLDDRHISVQHMANDVGITTYTIYGYLKGKSLPSGTLGCLIADYFGVSLDWLYGRSNCMEVRAQARNLIDRENYCKNICRCDRPNCDKMKCPIWLAPEATDRKHGENIADAHWSDRFECSECGLILEDYVQIIVDEHDMDESRMEFEHSFCPSCGAPIRKEE